jgi:tRNA pseudouridine38-40 synthase
MPRNWLLVEMTFHEPRVSLSTVMEDEHSCAATSSDVCKNWGPPRGREKKAKAKAKEDRAARLQLAGVHRFRAVVQYDGTDFEGWQTQSHGKTVQDTVERRLGSVLGKKAGERLAIAGSGRTDAGVHAKAQVFHVDWPLGHWDFSDHAAGSSSSSCGGPSVIELTAARLLDTVRGGLPPTIRVIHVEPVADTFHARHSCTAKRYVYTVIDAGLPSPWQQRFSWAPCPSQSLDVGLMQEAADLLVGTHDFTAFGKVLPGDPRDPVKSMRSILVHREPPPDLPPRRDGEICAAVAGTVVTITATCNRFLWNMMRRIAGTLVQVLMTPIN